MIALACDCGFSTKVHYQVAAPAELRTLNLHRATECGWRDGDRGGPARTKQSNPKKKNKLVSQRPSHGRH